MPIYEYRCQACGHELEAMQKMSDDPLIVCPECNQPGLKKKLSAAGFRLKGGGWYETDFKGGSKKNLHDTGKKASEKDSSDKGKKKASEKDSSDKGKKKAPEKGSSGTSSTSANK